MSNTRQEEAKRQIKVMLKSMAEYYAVVKVCRLVKAVPFAPVRLAATAIQTGYVCAQWYRVLSPAFNAEPMYYDNTKWFGYERCLFGNVKRKFEEATA